ncbi:MAG TPA: hypothetical protein PK095_09245 [Myxococcota bacterium]|nr:hypothetical protein [Myxococcota bacterium]
MKRLGLITALLLSSSACGGKSAPDMPPASEFPAAGESAKTLIRAPGENARVLRYAAKAGDKNTADMDIDMSISGGGVDMSFKMQIGAESAVDEVDDKGTFKQSMTITSATMKLGGELAAMGGDTSQIGDMLKGQKMSFKMDNQGRVLEADMGEGNPMMQQMQAGMDQAMQGGVVPFPSDAVGVGAQWDALTTVDMMGAKMRMVSSYKLVELNGDKGTLEIAIGGNAEAQKMNMQGAGEVDLKSMNMKATGKIGFDLARPTAGSVDLKMNIEMDLSAQGQSATMKMDMGIKMTSK